MNLTPIKINLQDYPLNIQPYLDGAKVFDSSCSPQAKVLFSKKDDGYFIKCSAKNSLSNEYAMTKYFHSLGLAPTVFEYVSLDKDYLVTQKVEGSDGSDEKYINDPRRICETIASLLRKLHDTKPNNCPIADHTSLYLDTAENNYMAGHFDKAHFSNIGANDPRAVWQEITAKKHLLQNEVLIHGDYCLPNIILNNWKLSSFIDLGNGGIGDRHVDIYWGIYTLYYNLHTERYIQYFMDAYGKDLIDKERLRLISKIELFG